ncbi:MAG TPA: hypothetical protein VGL72_11225 [Bryobacteraceae bacterium]
MQAAMAFPSCLALQAARKAFWDSKDPAGWSPEEKQLLLLDSPWAQAGFARMEVDNQRANPDDNKGLPSGGMPDYRPGPGSGNVRPVQTGEAVPPVPKPDSHPVQFRVLARWESAKPVRLAAGPEVPELTGQFYVIRLRGLPLMPPRKAKADEAAPNPNEALLQVIKEGSRLERKGKGAIPCTHLFNGSGDAATDVLLFFARPADPITVSDKFVTLESRFNLFHLSIKFPLKDMVYKGELTL